MDNNRLAKVALFLKIANFYPKKLPYTLFEATVAQKRVGARFTATEVFVHVHGVVDTAGGEHVFAELGGYFLVEDVARFLEGFKTIRIKHFRPYIAVITGRIAAAHCMTKVGRAVAGRYLRGQTTFAQGICLEIHNVEVELFFVGR